MRASIKVTGDKKLIRQLEKFGDRVQKRVQRRAVNLAMTPILQSARAFAPALDGTLKRAMAKKVYTAGAGRVGGIVGADESVVRVKSTGKIARGEAAKAASAGGDVAAKPSNYDHLVEFGHVNADGSETPAHPFLRPAWDSSIGQARAKYESELATGIEREAMKE